MRTETRSSIWTSGRDKVHAVASGERRWTGLDSAMLASFALEVAGTVVAARLGRGWTTALIRDALVTGSLCAIAARPAWRPLISRLLGVGIVAGLLELGTDLAGEHVVHSLVYPPHEPMLLASPIYMPLSWMTILAQIGYLAWRLDGLLPRRAWTVLLMGLWGAVNIPFYEEMAYHAGWWHYTDRLRIGHTPIYVMLFEGLVVAALPFLLRDIERKGWRGVALRGVLLGVWMPWAALLAWLPLGR